MWMACTCAGQPTGQFRYSSVQFRVGSQHPTVEALGGQSACTEGEKAVVARHTAARLPTRQWSTRIRSNIEDSHWTDIEQRGYSIIAHLLFQVNSKIAIAGRR